MPDISLAKTPSAKANTMHPGTTRLLAEEAQLAAEETNMPDGIVQLIYRMSHEDGERLARDPRLAAIGYTGSQHAGLKLGGTAGKGEAAEEECEVFHGQSVVPWQGRVVLTKGITKMGPLWLAPRRRETFARFPPSFRHANATGM